MYQSKEDFDIATFLYVWDFLYIDTETKIAVSTMKNLTT